jgi:site-specific recombinase XerD
MNALPIYEVEPKVRSVFTELGFSERRIYDLIVFVHKIIRLHEEHSKKHFCVDIATDYVKLQESRQENGEISEATVSAYKSMVRYIVQICETGAISKNRRSSFPVLPEHFEQILADMLDNDEWTPKSRQEYYNHTRTFFRWLSEQGHTDLKCDNAEIIRKYLVHCSIKMTGGSLLNTRRSLKELLLFVSEDSILSEEMNRLFFFSIPVGKKIQPFMPQDEIAAVLNIIDRGTAVGKRDYAMILLAAVTGLRGVDIRELSLNSVCWSCGEMRIIQEKTGRALALPLTTDVGEAIREYILNGRPQSSSDKVFLSALAPFGELRRGTPSSMLRRYCVKAKLDRKWGFHTIRRSIATNMVTSGVSVITVAQELGQYSINSTRQYISLDSKNLMQCALDFSGIEIGGAER